MSETTDQTRPTTAQYELFQVRVGCIVRDLWESYKERRAIAEEQGTPWDDFAERQLASVVGGTALEIFDLTGDGLVSDWEWDGSDRERAEAYVRDVTSPFPTGQHPVPENKLWAIIRMSNDQFLAARAIARRRPIGPDDRPQEGLA